MMNNYRLQIRVKGTYDPTLPLEADNPGEFKTWGQAYEDDLINHNWQNVTIRDNYGV